MSKLDALCPILSRQHLHTVSKPLCVLSAHLVVIASACIIVCFMDMDLVGVLAFTLVFTFGSQLHLGWHLHLDVHLCLYLCLRSGGICGCIGGHHGYGVYGCGCNVGGGFVGMGNQWMMVMKKEG
jgi:hypothetical protein